MAKKRAGKVTGLNAGELRRMEHLTSQKGGPAGANQGGASRGGTRVEPSHSTRASRQARANGKGKKGR